MDDHSKLKFLAVFSEGYSLAETLEAVGCGVVDLRAAIMADQVFFDAVRAAAERQGFMHLLNEITAGPSGDEVDGDA